MKLLNRNKNKDKEVVHNMYLNELCEIIFKNGKDSVIGRITGLDFDENYNIRRMIINDQISIDMNDVLAIEQSTHTDQEVSHEKR